jgi:hypothetical protein
MSGKWEATRIPTAANFPCGFFRLKTAHIIGLKFAERIAFLTEVQEEVDKIIY